MNKTIKKIDLITRPKLGGGGGVDGGPAKSLYFTYSFLKPSLSQNMCWGFSICAASEGRTSMTLGTPETVITVWQFYNGQVNSLGRTGASFCPS